MSDIDEKPEMMSWEEYNTQGRNPRSAREAELAKIEARWEQRLDGQEALAGFDMAVKSADERHKDVTQYPAGINRMKHYYEEAIVEAGKSRIPIRDWNAKFDEIADRARVDMGLKPLHVREHEADMAEMKQDREKGKKPLPQE